MGIIYWLTGLSGSGKTSIARSLEKRMCAEVLDGDDIRKLTHNKDFSKQSRINHMYLVAELANRFRQYNDVIVSMISPIKIVRDSIKYKYDNVKEIYIKCSKEECIRRDPKGLWKKAMSGEIKNFTGFSDIYEEPVDALVVDTERLSLEESTELILNDYKEDLVKEFIFRIRNKLKGGLKNI